MHINRVFDPDLEVHYLRPDQLTWPLYARIHTEYLPLAVQKQLGEIVMAGHTLPYALFTKYRKEGNFFSACVFGTNEQVWVPWSMVSPTLNYHAN